MPGEEHRGNEDEEGGVMVQPVLKAEADQEHYPSGGERDPIGAGRPAGR
jgi:hypothetical protein